jgi:putative ABC transport system ATP-binding protein
MMDLITGIASEHNQTLIIVTHDTEISQYADQIIHIRDGNIESITDNANKILPGHHAPVKKEEEEEDDEQLQLQEVQAV